ncbi:hypothetical protein CYMTET_7396 [Cymbomonas tetramitiformis]|uniref:Uncharacterized protein n=1 Tax=Cymbomonas tetramitiformis TaxID=36881 RepID=A0AAE0GVB7_9CHLO|nr:hypothetical protein CYMTET_7396 [Cymbomonas tetramitiformis]
MLPAGPIGTGPTAVQRQAQRALQAPGGTRAYTGAGPGVGMEAVRTPQEAFARAESDVRDWHEKLSVEHSKLGENEIEELCRKIEMDHRWPAPVSGNDAIGSVFTAPVKACFHAKGYESARDRSRGWVNELKAGLKSNPYSPKNAGLVDISGITRQDFDLTKFNKGKYPCKVFGHQHTGDSWRP